MNAPAVIPHLNNLLNEHIIKNTPNHPIREVYHYAVMPPGKLFRPQLAWAVASDFGKIPLHEWTEKSAHSLLASSIEIHHAYTLVHDDLPCMDNDDMRRGKPSTHKAFGEWRALLVGDGLLSLSYRLLSMINNQHLPKLLKLFSWATGAKGLIHGQVLDLSEEIKNDFASLLLTHKLKTARLIQTAICGSYLLLPHYRFKEFYALFKLGNALGIAFQLLDDLTELTDSKLSAHEASIAPWLNYPAQAQAELELRLSQVDQFLEYYKTPELNRVVREYFAKILGLLQKDEEQVKSHLAKTAGKAQLAPLMALLQRIS